MRDGSVQLKTVSIHAPVMGANHLAHHRFRVSGFNPRTRDECELVSTFSCIALASFNPRTRDGCE